MDHLLAYANHSMRLYFSEKDFDTLSVADRANVSAMNVALGGVPDGDINLLMLIFGGEYKGVADSVKAVSAAQGVEERTLWCLIRTVTRRFAVARGLL